MSCRVRSRTDLKFMEARPQIAKKKGGGLWLGIAAYACYPRIWQVEAGGSGAQSQCWLVSSMPAWTDTHPPLPFPALSPKANTQNQKRKLRMQLSRVPAQQAEAPGSISNTTFTCTNQEKHMPFLSIILSYLPGKGEVREQPEQPGTHMSPQNSCTHTQEAIWPLETLANRAFPSLLDPSTGWSSRREPTIGSVLQFKHFLLRGGVNGTLNPFGFHIKFFGNCFWKRTVCSVPVLHIGFRLEQKWEFGFWSCHLE